MLARLFVFSVCIAIASCTSAKATTCTPPVASGCPMAAGSKANTGGFAIEVKKGDAAVTEYEAGAKYMVTLKRTGTTTSFKGFTLQANEAAGADATGGLGKKYVGEFGGTLPAKTMIGCGDTPADVKGAVSHDTPAADTWAAGSVGPFEWTAPATGDKDVYFNAIGVQAQDTWYGETDAISKKLTKKAATQAVDCTAAALNTKVECDKKTDDCVWKADTSKCEAKPATTVVDCTAAALNTKVECDKKTDDCVWKADTSKCEAKPATTVVDCTAAALNTKVECDKKTDDCVWKADTSKCEAKPATTVVDCTADALKTKEECDKKTAECTWNADDSKCEAKAAAKCSDKTAEADCTAMTGCTWDANKCATTTSVECPKKTTEDACKGMTGCKWNTDKCEEAVTTQDDGAFKLTVGLAAVLLAVVAHLF